MKKFLRTIALVVFGLAVAGLFLVAGSNQARAASNERMMDDAVFDNSGSMSASDIQNFLNQFPNSCLKNYSDEYPNDYFSYGGAVSAATVIRRASDLWGINPRVLLGKLEQEENLVTGNAGCNLYQYVSAVGYDCPGSIRTAVFRGTTLQTCVQHDAAMGFSRQITKGAWVLKFAKERANDNLNWLVPDDGNVQYYGVFTNAGMHKRCSSCAPIYHDGYFNGVDVQTGATASFYNYTPFLNQAFDEIYEGWFGSTYAAPWRWEFVSQTWSKNIAALPRGEKATITLKARNIGSNTWSNSGPNPVRLATTRPIDRGSGFNSGWLSGSRVVNLSESTVAPNQIGTFVFEVQANPPAGNYNEYFSLVAENSGWFNDLSFYLGFGVLNPLLSGQITENNIPTTMTANSTTSVTIKVKNTGNSTWYNSGNNPVDIYTDPYDRQSVFQGSGWIEPRKPARLNEASVLPGQIGTFTFSMKAPSENGTYTEVFRLGMSNIGWLDAYVGQTIPVTNGQVAPNKPVYRHYNPVRQSHFYTTNLNESNIIRGQGWNYEGIAYQVSASPNNKPVYRHYNPSVGRHFYTTDANESNNIRGQGWNYEGIAWYASEITTSIPVYRHYNSSIKAHFYTIDINESNIIRSQGWNYEGIAWYGMP